jgi:hypothetical protein
MVSRTADNGRATHGRPGKVWEWIMAAVVQPRQALSPLARHTLQTLATYADPDGSNCYPTYQGLADRMGRSRGVAGDGLRELEQRGWLERRTCSVDGQRRTLFVPLVPAPGDAASSGPPDDPRDASSGPPDGNRPAHRTQPVQDQSKEEEDARARVDGNVPTVSAGSTREVQSRTGATVEAPRTVEGVVARLGLPKRHRATIRRMITARHAEGARLDMLSDVASITDPAGVDSPAALIRWRLSEIEGRDPPEVWDLVSEWNRLDEDVPPRWALEGSLIEFLNLAMREQEV